MKRNLVLTLLCTVLSTLWLAAECAEVKHKIPNKNFSREIAGVMPAPYKEYMRVQKDMNACMADNHMESGVCVSVERRLGNLMYDAFLHAQLVNMNAVPSEEKFCDPMATKLVQEDKRSEAAAYALLLIDERVKYGASLYGEALEETYVGKIVYDALADSKPCKK